MSAHSFDRVEVLIGIMDAIFRTDKTGKYDLVPIYKERARVLVEVVDNVGNRQSIWDGEDMIKALHEAREIGQAYGLPVIDLTGKGGCQ